jgi:hypothetical protein
VANTRSKIEKFGKVNVVDALILEGKTAGAIAECLRREHGLEISDTAVERYVARRRVEAKPAAREAFHEHCKATVNEDLASLEAIMAQAKRWWEEEPKDAGRRIAAKAAQLEGELDGWVEAFESARRSDSPEAARRTLVRAIVARALDLFAEDARLQKKRVEAMGVHLATLKLKLGNVGLLVDDDKGRIFIIDRSADYRPSDPSTSGTGRTAFPRHDHLRQPAPAGGGERVGYGGTGHQHRPVAREPGVRPWAHSERIRLLRGRGGAAQGPHGRVQNLRRYSESVAGTSPPG